MDKWIGRVALVTGSSAGIGAAVASALVDHGMHVIGCGRNIDKLKELKETVKGKGTFTPIQCDVTSESSVISMFEEAKSKFGGIDVLINNAGLNKDTTLLGGATDDWKTLLDTNIMGLSICAREGFKSMKAKGADDGYIVNVGSILGHFVAKQAHVTHMYSGSKFAVRALTEGLRNEVRDAGTNIRVTHLSPGVVETEFRIRMQGEEAAKKFYGSLRCLQGNDIADAVVYVLSTPPHVQVTELMINTTDVPFSKAVDKK